MVDFDLQLDNAEKFADMIDLAIRRNDKSALINLYHEADVLLKQEKIFWGASHGQKQRIENILAVKFNFDIKRNAPINNNYNKTPNQNNSDNQDNDKSWWKTNPNWGGSNW